MERCVQAHLEQISSSLMTLASGLAPAKSKFEASGLANVKHGEVVAAIVVEMVFIFQKRR